MSAEEKAEYLVYKFKEYTEDTFAERFHYAKQCALIVVDEILFEISHNIKLDWVKERTDETDFISYWQKVKTEIQKL